MSAQSSLKPPSKQQDNESKSDALAIEEDVSQPDEADTGSTILIRGLIIIDVYGHERRELGGGAPQAAVAAKVWSKSVLLAAPVGRDFFELDEYGRLASFGLDLAGVVAAPSVDYTPSTEIFYEDEERHEIPLQGWDTFGSLCRSNLVCNVESVSRVHVLIERAGGAELDFALALPEEKQLSLELVLPHESGFEITDLVVDSLCRITSRALMVSPDLRSASDIAGVSFSTETLDQGIALKVLPLCGARLGMKPQSVLAVRAGAGGSFLWAPCYPQQIWHIPVVETCVTDPTGAGNAYAGALAALLPKADTSVPLDYWWRKVLWAAKRATATAAEFVAVHGIPHLEKISTSVLQSRAACIEGIELSGKSI